MNDNDFSDAILSQLYSIGIEIFGTTNILKLTDSKGRKITEKSAETIANTHKERSKN